MKIKNLRVKAAIKMVFAVVGLCPCLVYGVNTPMSAEKHDLYFPLVDEGSAAVFVIDPNDAEVVSIAAEAVGDDIRIVTQVSPVIVRQLPAQSDVIVLAGTCDKNRWIRRLIEQKKIDIKHLQNQPWESYMIAVVEKPFDGIKQALVIVGSDRRGAAYGLFELSAMAGVSPWIWWADVTPDKQRQLYIKPGSYSFGPPSVQYRGVFLNDEDYGLKPWAAKTYEPQVGDIGPKTYAKICELLLRLKANYLWPAMHECTGAFNIYPGNKVVADRYAIVMGSSHCEPLLFNNATEWKKETMGPWQYDTNRSGILKILDNRIKENGRYENVYTMGMRGIHDTGMLGDMPMPDRVKTMEHIFDDQREILERHTGKVAEKIPQIFVPYKEVLPIYDAGLNVPQDITLVWADDNYGYIRRFSSEAEQKRSGGAGVYYHISYWGIPHRYMWLGTTPPSLIWKEMQRLFMTGGRRLWVVNVGDIKPCENGMEFFLQMAWDISRWNEDNLQGYTTTIASRDFGPQLASEIGDILNTYYILNFQRKPEFMGFNRSYPYEEIKDPKFSLWNYNDECARRVDAFEFLLKRAEAVYSQIPEYKRDAYYQLVLYPILGSAKINEKILSAYRSREYVKQGRISANQYATKAQQAYEAIVGATSRYNNEIAGGKWRYMMSYEQRGESVFKMPPVGETTAVQSGLLGLAMEGFDKAVKPVKGELNSSSELPRDNLVEPEQAVLRFDGIAGQRYFIDLFNYGKTAVSWEISLSEKWIQCSQLKGIVDGQDLRLWVMAGASHLPEDASGFIRINSGQLSYEIKVQVHNREIAGDKGYFGQVNGIISINAADTTTSLTVRNRRWKPINGLGRTGQAMGLFPMTGWYCNDLEQAKSDCPVIKYRIAVSTGGKANVILQAVPAFPLELGREICCASSIDDGPAQWLTFEVGDAEGGDAAARKLWEGNVLNGMMQGRGQLDIPQGIHTLCIWGTDPSVVLDKIIISFTDIPSGYPGPLSTQIQ